MLRLKLKEPYDQVFLGVNLENPLTGESITVDGKIDTGAIVTVVPMHLIEEMGLEILGERYLATADGSSVRAVVCICNVSISDEDAFEVAVHAIKSQSNNVLIGMDILNQCDLALWHDYSDEKETIFFELQQAINPKYL